MDRASTVKIFNDNGLKPDDLILNAFGRLRYPVLELAEGRNNILLNMNIDLSDLWPD